jgi:hypothetical protein
MNNLCFEKINKYDKRVSVFKKRNDKTTEFCFFIKIQPFSMVPFSLKKFLFIQKKYKAMKKTMFFRFLFLLCLPMLGNAQFQKNCWMLGGDASLTRNFVPANTFASHNGKIYRICPLQDRLGQIIF